MSLLHCKKSTSSLSYLGSKLAPICTVLPGFLISICTALASSSALKTLDVGGITGLSGAVGNWRWSSLSSTAMNATVVISMLFYSQSSGRCVLTSTVMTPMGPCILSLR
jgi:hypothetical protein